MKKKLLSLALALVMCLGLMPTAVFAAEGDLPDWYFLFAIFKNVDADCNNSEGKTVHTKYSMSQDEIDITRDNAREFEEYMNSVGVMRAHVDVVEIDATITELADYANGSFLSPKEAAPLLKSKVDLDQYDHVTCVYSLNVGTDYLGRGGSSYENGTGHTGINIVNQEYCLDHFSAEKATEIPASIWPPAAHVHEFLHFMEHMTKRFGTEFGLHDIRINFYVPDDDEGKECYRDIMLNRARGTDGTGVNPAAWQCPPRVVRTIKEWTVPSGVTGIGDWAFQNCTTLNKVTIPGSVASIGKVAFRDCANLTEVTISSSLTSIGNWAFGHCPALTRISLPASVTSIGYAAFYDTGIKDVYYGGTETQWKAIQIGEYNEALTKAKIHYNSNATTTPDQPTKPAKPETASPTNDKLEVNGTAANPTVYKIGGSNYFKIRDVAALLNGTEKQFAVGYDGALSSVTATTGQGYDKQAGDLAGAATGGNQTAAVSNDAIYVDGQKVEAEVYKINGSNYFKLRDLGRALNFYVGWSAERGMYIETDKPYAE